MKKKYVVIVAGGKGLRMGSDLPKQFMPIAGKPVLMHTIERFYQWDRQAAIILVLPEEHQVYWKMLCQELKFDIPYRIANGGATRFQSVKNGLELVGEPGLIAVHDGVRPFVSVEVIKSCFARAAITGAAIPVVQVVDSMRELDADGKSAPVDRNRFVAVQTPQVFRSDILLEAYKCLFRPEFTDDASVVEAKGYTIYTVRGNWENIKITSPSDLLVAKAYLHKM